MPRVKNVLVANKDDKKRLKFYLSIWTTCLTIIGPTLLLTGQFFAKNFLLKLLISKHYTIEHSIINTKLVNEKELN